MTQNGKKNYVNVGKIERAASCLGGTALAVMGLRRRDRAGLALALAGGSLLWRGASGHCHTYSMLGMSTAPDNEGIHVTEAVTINRPVEEVYGFWRDFQNLPMIMEHLESVAVTDGGRSHWVAKAPLNQTVEWDAETTEDVPNQRIAWRSVEGSEIQTSGVVVFTSAPAGRGTEVRVELDYVPPAGLLGATVAKFFGEEPSLQLKDDLKRLRSRLEAGEIPTSKGQSHGPSMKRDMKAAMLETAA
jgi:uncharacterized membrane protein